MKKQIKKIFKKLNKLALAALLAVGVLVGSFSAVEASYYPAAYTTYYPDYVPYPSPTVYYHPSPYYDIYYNGYPVSDKYYTVCYEVYCYLQPAYYFPGTPNTNPYANQPVAQKVTYFTPYYFMETDPPYLEYSNTVGEYTSAFYGAMGEIQYYQDLTMYEIQHVINDFWRSL